MTLREKGKLEYRGASAEGEEQEEEARKEAV